MDTNNDSKWFLIITLKMWRDVNKTVILIDVSNSLAVKLK